MELYYSMFLFGTVAAGYTAFLYIYYVSNFEEYSPEDPLVSLMLTSTYLTVGIYAFACMSYLLS